MHEPVDARRPVVAEDVERLTGKIRFDEHAGAPVIAFSRLFQEADAAIKGLLHPHMYRHPRLMIVREEAERVVQDLFRRFIAEPTAMPDEWQAGLAAGDEARLARRVADYIAGMTDRYALLEHRRLFERTPDLSF